MMAKEDVRLTFSVISWEWCSECSLSRNMRCCSVLAKRQVSQVHRVQQAMPREASDSAPRWTDWSPSGRLTSTRTNWMFRIPPISPQMQQAENNIICQPDRETRVRLLCEQGQGPSVMSTVVKHISHGER